MQYVRAVDFEKVVELLPDFGLGWDAAIGARIYPAGIGKERDDD